MAVSGSNSIQHLGRIKGLAPHDAEVLGIVVMTTGGNEEVNASKGIYIDGPRGITPLHEAYWSAELTKQLLEKGADPKAKDSDGKTPLDWARGEPATGVCKSR